ncbi:MAG: hypothetical protein LIP23_09975 [Planctomycetes bacterium]|nr:hypothetical protein [Planctomycetota bacterium]
MFQNRYSYAKTLSTTVLLAVAALFCLGKTAHAAESGVTLERVITAQTADRDRLAKNITVHTFENSRDPDTGVLLPDSNDYNLDGWPDFWEPIRAVGYPEYLIDAVTIVEDTTGQIPGRYRDLPNHALRLSYDGTRVGIRTREPVPVDPELAYEFSLRSKDTGLAGAAVRAGVDWLRVDPATVRLVRTDILPAIPTGQLDWAVTPWRMLINDPPDDANAARLFVAIERLPNVVGGDYHGEILLDDITFRRHPKISVAAPRQVADSSAMSVPVTYTGLFDNVPDPDNPGFFQGKSYFRRVEVTDVFNRPLPIQVLDRAEVRPDDDGVAVEDIIIPRDRYGVYYLNLRLYDADRRLATDAARAVAVMRQPETRGDALTRSTTPSFGIAVGSPPDSVLASPGLLRDILTRAGVKQTKVIPWRTSYADPGQGAPYYAMLADSIRSLRAAGIGITGVIQPPTAMFTGNGVASAVMEQTDRLTTILTEAGRSLGLFLDGWQWGGDGDASLAGFPDNDQLRAVSSAINEFSGGLPLAWNVRLDQPAGRFPVQPGIVQAYLPAIQPEEALWPTAAPVFPWLYEPFFLERGRIYPPRILSLLAPAPPVDRIEEAQRQQIRSGSWIAIEPEPAHPYEPNAAGERVQLEQMLVRAIYAAALSPDTVFLGDLFNPARGLLRRDTAGGTAVETLARPAFLAAGTLSTMLEGAEYLGRLGLLPPFHAHVFRRPNSDSSVIAIWQDSQNEERMLDRSEIAAGVTLHQTDWAGNVAPLSRSVSVTKVPSFITGLPASLALTRMSVRIAPEPQILAVNRRQDQFLEIVNHLPRQAPVLFRLRYAARPDDGGMEDGWTVAPGELRVNLPPVSPEFTAGRIRYTVTPDPNSPVQKAGPNRVDKNGLKVAQAVMGVATSPPADMVLYLPFELQSELDVDIERLERADDPNFITLQLRVRWFPADGGRRRGEIRLTPFYMKWGQMKETTPFPITVRALQPELRGSQETMFESVELRIPRTPQARTWIGLDENGGSGFYLADVTDFL